MKIVIKVYAAVLSIASMAALIEKRRESRVYSAPFSCNHDINSQIYNYSNK